MDNREYKVADYPDLRKRTGGVINTNFSDYTKRKRILKNFEDVENLKEKVQGLEGKIDLILSILTHDYPKSN